MIFGEKSNPMMAFSCTIVGLIITGTTLGIVARRCIAVIIIIIIVIVIIIIIVLIIIIMVIIRYSRADRIKIPKEVETQMLDGQ